MTKKKLFRRSVAARVLVMAFAVWMAAMELRAVSEVSLTNVSQVLASNQRPAKNSLRAELDVWVVAVEPARAAFFIRDASGGMELGTKSFTNTFQIGDRIELSAALRPVNGRATLEGWQVRSLTAAPAPQSSALNERAPALDALQWSQAEGVVEFIGDSSQGAELDIASHNRHLFLNLQRVPASAAGGLLHRRISVHGLAQASLMDGAQPVFSRMWAGGLNQVHLVNPSIQDWSAAIPITADCSNCPAGDGALVRLSGRIEVNADPGVCAVIDATGRMPVNLLDAKTIPDGSVVEVIGLLQRTGKQPSLACASYRPLANETNALPLLTTIEQIHRLKPEEAGKNYPVRIRGVATGGFGYIQDETRGISVSNVFNQLNFGSSYEIQGTTGSGLYAPLICPVKITYLGPGQLPAPIHPTWEYLASGSAVCQWLELQGLVISATNNWLTLAIPGGRVEAEVQGARPSSLAPMVNAIVRIRGTCRSDYNLRRQITRFWISVPSTAFISEEVPARGDLFDAAARSIAEIQQFDVDAYQIRRIKVAGQVTFQEESSGYLSDGTNCLKYFLQSPAKLSPGDEVELVGFPDAGDFSPVLREAIWKKIGHEPLVRPALRNYDELASGEFNAARVRVRGRVLAEINSEKESLLTLLVQSNTVAAHVLTLAKPDGPLAQVGSLIELTGICASRSLRNNSGNEANTFELLVQSPEDVEILERPSWWNFRHSLAVACALGAVLLLALGWIHLLRSKVAERTRQLQAQMEETERVERRRALEQERSRIARDLHDNLGACLTEISMLAESGQRTEPNAGDSPGRFNQILDRAHTLVHTLDETVWAVDPAKDTLPSLVRYLTAYAEEFISAAHISCRVEVPTDVPERALTTEVRHDFYLAAKEALNNAVRHAHAREIRFQIQIGNGEMEIKITDDGCGFDSGKISGGNGLSNLRERMNHPGRRCEITSSPGKGTTVLLAVALPKEEIPRPS